MRTLIVDDEPVARALLREQLQDIPGVDVVGEAATGEEAVEKIRSQAPDLVLLDLQMPELDGIAVARALHSGRAPLIIYVTAHRTHALEAFEVGAVDYLLKPVRPERLASAVEKARTHLAARRLASGALPEVAGSTLLPWRIPGRRGDEIHLLDPEDVIAFQAAGDLVYVTSTKGRFEVSDSLKDLERKLPPPRFRRIHRAAIVNTAHILKISPLTSRRWLLHMSNGLEIIVSKRMAAVLRTIGTW